MTLRAVGYLGYWDQKRAIAVLTQRTDPQGLQLTHVSPSWYAPTTAGAVIKQETSVDDSAATVTAIKTAGVKLVPAVANYVNKRWTPTATMNMLTNPGARTVMVRNLAALTLARGYDGIDIDFEHLPVDARVPLVLFVRELAGLLHPAGKHLAVTVHPKSWEPGPQPKNKAQDYAGLATAADELRIMLYDYHWDTGDPGPLAPITWVKQVAKFATTIVPAAKLTLGFATYGYDWPTDGSGGESHMHTELAALAKAKGVAIRYDATTGGSRFSYPGHAVWLEDAASLRPKVELARTLGLGGVHFWRLGGDDPAIWT
jgi:spore germination protein